MSLVKKCIALASPNIFSSALSSMEIPDIFMQGYLNRNWIRQNTKYLLMVKYNTKIV